jgi:hypothetical protein
VLIHLPQVAPAGIKLYKYVTAGSLGKWELSSSAAKPHFYDALEDSSSAGKKSDWFMVVGAGTMLRNKWFFVRICSIDDSCHLLLRPWFVTSYRCREKSCNHAKLK